MKEQIEELKHEITGLAAALGLMQEELSQLRYRVNDLEEGVKDKSQSVLVCN